MQTSQVTTNTCAVRFCSIFTFCALWSEPLSDRFRIRFPGRTTCRSLWVGSASGCTVNWPARRMRRRRCHAPDPYSTSPLASVWRPKQHLRSECSKLLRSPTVQQKRAGNDRLTGNTSSGYPKRGFDRALCRSSFEAVRGDSTASVRKVSLNGRLSDRAATVGTYDLFQKECSHKATRGPWVIELGPLNVPYSTVEGALSYPRPPDAVPYVVQ
jgi:hypothetical protein